MAADMTLRDPHLSPTELKDHLRLLETERAFALSTSLANNTYYMADLQDELDATRTAYATAAVIEAAQAMARSRGRLQG